jgi:hypothetical protein
MRVTIVAMKVSRVCNANSRRYCTGYRSGSGESLPNVVCALVEPVNPSGVTQLECVFAQQSLVHAQAVGGYSM